MWRNALERGQSSFTKTLSKSLSHDANLVKHTNYLLNDSNAKFPNRQQESLTLCLKSLHQSLKYRLGTSLCQKYWAKSILSKLIIFCNLLNSTGKKLERREDIFPDDLEQVYGIVIKRKLRQTGQEETTPKLIKVWLGQHKVVFQSFYVSSGVAFYGNNDL